MMNRNIYIIYALTVCKNSWFWLGIWVFYYLKFTSYAGIGFMETTMGIIWSISEVPTGAVADLLGKKPTLFLAFLLQALGIGFLASAQQYNHLLIGVSIAGLGGALSSGTIEALVYDTLKQWKKEKTYSTVLARMTFLQLATPAAASIIGGYLYTIYPRLPFILHASMYAIGTILTLFLTEPLIDSIKFSLKNFLSQTTKGMQQLFVSDDIRTQTIVLLSIGGIVVIFEEMLNNFLGVEFGYKEHELGVIWAIISIIGALAAQSSPWIHKNLKLKRAYIILGCIIAITAIMSPWIGIILGSITIVIRYASAMILGNLTSIAINERTPSAYRATTLSTFNMIKGIPYVLLAWIVGSAADIYTARIIACILGGILLLLLMFQSSLLFMKRDKHH